MAERIRNFAKEKSFSHLLFLQHWFSIETVEQYFIGLSKLRKLKIYDFGCGQKPYSIFAINHEYIGIDSDPSNCNADIFSDVTSVPNDDCSADIVVSFFVLEHVRVPTKMIQEMYRILKKEGQLFMLVPLYWEEHEQPNDFYRFTRYGIYELLISSGFKEIEIQVVNSTPSIIGLHIVRYFNRPFIKTFIPMINWVFWILENRAKENRQKLNINETNVMTFSVKAFK